MFDLEENCLHLQMLCAQTVKSVVTAGLPSGYEIAIKGLICITVNNNKVILVDLNENPESKPQGLPSSPNMGNVRRSLVGSMGTPTRRGRPPMSSPRGRISMSPRTPRGTSRLQSPRGVSPRTPRGMVSRGMSTRGMSPRGMRGGMVSPRGMNPQNMGQISGPEPINITPQAMPKSNPTGGGSNGDVIEIIEDDDTDTKGGVMHNSTSQATTIDVKPSIPFQADMTEQRPHNVPQLGSVSSMNTTVHMSPMPKLEPHEMSSPSNNGYPPQKRLKNENHGSSMIFKTESSASASTGQPEGFKCPLCAKTFQFRSWFEKHLLGHENKGDLVAGACDGVVKQLIHCKYCPKKFKYQIDLDAHMNTHIKETVKCAHCGMNYTNRKQLMEHIEREHKSNPQGNGGGLTLNAEALGLI